MGVISYSHTCIFTRHRLMEILSHSHKISLHIACWLMRWILHRYIYCFILHNDIFRYKASWNNSHISGVISLCTVASWCPCSYRPKLVNFLVFTATFLWLASTRLEQQLKYQLGVWVAPIVQQLYLWVTNFNQRFLVWNKPLITFWQSGMTRYFTLRLYFHSLWLEKIN